MSLVLGLQWQKSVKENMIVMRKEKRKRKK